MSDLVNAQQEFEELIEQLERLKTVNEMTSQNAENSTAVIDELKRFSEKFSPFLDKIYEEHKEIAARVDDAISSLDESIVESKKVSKDTEQAVGQHVSAMKEELSKVADDLARVAEDLSKADQDLSEIKELGEGTQDRLLKIAEVLKKIRGDQKKMLEMQARTDTVIKSRFDGMTESITVFREATQVELKKQSSQQKTLKVFVWVILILMIAGFVGLGLLINPVW